MCLLQQDEHAIVELVESRPSKKKIKSIFEIYLKIKCTFSKFMKITSTIKQNKAFPDVIILESNDEEKFEKGLENFYLKKK